MWLELLQVFFFICIGSHLFNTCVQRVSQSFAFQMLRLHVKGCYRKQTYNNELFHYCPYGKNTEAFLFSNNLSALGLPWQQFVLYEISLVRLIMNSKDLVEIIEHYLVFSIVIFFHLIHLQCCKSHLIDYLIVLIGICYIN